MSSFGNPHYIFLFALVGGGRKMSYGRSPEDALEVLSFRLSPEEMAEIIPDDVVRINQRQMQKYVHLLR